MSESAIIVDTSFDTVRSFLEDLRAGRTTPDRAREIRSEIQEVAARLERVRRIMPGAACGLGDEVGALLREVAGGRGWLGQAALI